MKKRISMFIMSIMIIFGSVVGSYQEAYAFDIPTAFWGTLEASRAFWTALQAGGGVRGGGVSLSAFERSSRQDMQQLQTLTMKGYLHYCAFREKLRLMLEDSSLTEEEAETQASTSANQMVSNFNNNAINVSTTTGSITKKDYGYWRDYCDRIDYIARNGLNTGGTTIGPDTVIDPPFSNTKGVNYGHNISNVGANTLNYDDNYYIVKGVYNIFGNTSQREVFIDPSNSANDRIRLFCWGIAIGDYTYLYSNIIHINKLSGEIINNTLTLENNPTYTNTQRIKDFVENTNLPVFIYDANQNPNSVTAPFVSFCSNYVENLSVGQGSSDISDYDQDIIDALNNTEAGKAIKAGANEGTRAIVGANSIPVKRNGIRVGEETATGVIGWDIPDARTLEGAIAQPDTQEDVIEGMGIISVPESIVIGGTAEDVVSWPKTEAISIPKTDDEDIPTTIDDVISVQGGEFYPSQVDITEFFPFCIPFDIAYCVNKFHVAVGSAPIIHIPIVYPRALQGVLGQSYDVVIDFNEYIVLRNVIRYFILLLFIIGLMQITRNLIRG